MLASDERKSPFFCVLQRHCFLVPSRFSSAFHLSYEPNYGAYVLKSDKGDVYVGWSLDLQMRVPFHNAGKGVSFFYQFQLHEEIRFSFINKQLGFLPHY